MPTYMDQVRRADSGKDVAMGRGESQSWQHHVFFLMGDARW